MINAYTNPAGDLNYFEILQDDETETKLIQVNNGVAAFVECSDIEAVGRAIKEWFDENYIIPGDNGIRYDSTANVYELPTTWTEIP